MKIDIRGTFCSIERQFYVPQVMRRLENWCVWRLEEKKDGGKPTKVPYGAWTGYRASSTNPDTWASYKRACEVYDYFKPHGVVNGIGFFFRPEDNLVFIDIDHCIIDGELSDLAKEVVNMFPSSYWEISQSGEGLHCFTRGMLTRCFKRSDIGLEMYNKTRYVAFTGNSINPAEPCESQESIDALFNKYCTTDTPDGHEVIRHELSDSVAEILEKARHNPHNGKILEMLFDGKWQELGYKSQSEADLAFCQLLAFWCNRNTELIDEIFCSSQLYRKKWQGKYRENTLSRAVARTAIDKYEYMQSMDAHRDILSEEEFAEWSADKHRKNILGRGE